MEHPLSSRVQNRRPLSDLRPKVLYVDDEPGNLVVFTAGLGKQVEARTATSGMEGLKILESEEIPVVIADQRMPQMSGAEFLSEVARRYPQTMRMILTAYTRYEDAVAAINTGHVIRFLKKPWIKEELLAEIVTANELYLRTLENQQLRELLIHRERLSAIGQVSSGLVHELSNVAAILSTVEDIIFELEDGEDASEVKAIFASGAQKFSILLDSLRTYSQGADGFALQRRQEDLGPFVCGAVSLARAFHEVRALRALKVEAPDEPILVSIDSSKLSQVVLNLVKNAAEACAPGQGEIRVTVSRETDRATVQVRDNGVGISEELGRKLFASFCTTKGEKGTGLGLMMSRQIVEAHGGELTYTNLPTGGCSFSINLPIGGLS